jgi:uncharacterized protein with von Willebrand factor type A (vWA) domain
MTGSGDAILLRLGAFARTLRASGIDVGPARLITALRALEAVDISQRDDVYWALRCTLTSSVDDAEVFDVVFEVFWGRRVPPTAVRVAPPRAGDGEPDAARRETRRRLTPDEAPDEVSEEDESRLARLASEHERLQTLDFREYGEDELREARESLERVVRLLPQRRARRLRAAHDGRHIDARATLRQAIRHGGHPIERRWRAPKQVPRRLVFLVDVSGSMEPYARAVVLLLQTVVATGSAVEAFAFGTRLTRLTPHLAGRDPQRALRRAAEAVPDWAGGTRIGENLRAFNEVWGRRAVTRGAIVTVVSDGWERGDVGELAAAMARLRMTSHTVVWVNPLTGDPRFEPLAAGMAAALPHVDLFLPGHDLRSLTGLLEVLEAIDTRRGGGGAAVRDAAVGARA